MLTKYRTTLQLCYFLLYVVAISHCVSKCVMSFCLLNDYWLIDWLMVIQYDTIRYEMPFLRAIKSWHESDLSTSRNQQLKSGYMWPRRSSRQYDESGDSIVCACGWLSGGDRTVRWIRVRDSRPDARTVGLVSAVWSRRTALGTGALAASCDPR